jgi:hypothetical protein
MQVEQNPDSFSIITDEIDPKKHEYRGMKIEQTPRGFEVSVGRGMKLPGVYMNLLLASRAVDREIGMRNQKKLNKRPYTKRKKSA